MKETLDDQSRASLVQYRLERAKEALEEADILFVKNLSVQGGMPVPVDDSGLEALVSEKYDK